MAVIWWFLFQGAKGSLSAIYFSLRGSGSWSQHGNIYIFQIHYSPKTEECSRVEKLTLTFCFFMMCTRVHHYIRQRVSRAYCKLSIFSIKLVPEQHFFVLLFPCVKLFHELRKIYWILDVYKALCWRP